MPRHRHRQRLTEKLLLWQWCSLVLNNVFFLFKAKAPPPLIHLLLKCLVLSHLNYEFMQWSLGGLCVSAIGNCWMPSAENRQWWRNILPLPQQFGETTNGGRRSRLMGKPGCLDAVRMMWLTELVQNPQSGSGSWRRDSSENKEAYRRRLWDSTWQVLMCFTWIIPVYMSSLHAEWGEDLMLEVSKLHLI